MKWTALSGFVPNIVPFYSDYTTTDSGGSVIEGDDNPYYVDASPTHYARMTKGHWGQGDSGVGIEDQSYGSDIASEAKTGWINGGGKNRLKRLSAMIEAPSNSSVSTAVIYRDLATTAWQTLNVHDFSAHNDATAAYEWITQECDIGKWDWLQIAMKDSGPNMQAISSIQIGFTPQEEPRGVVSGTQYHDGAEAPGG
jgi:hypothetical protein